MTKNWFEVDRKGLRQLQEGKSKTFVVRELLQNAFDEDIKTCKLYINYNGYNKATIIIEDDSPIGFRDLSDAYTLFKETHKRNDATKRGRFNLGEKQVFAICESAEIITTLGSVTFDATGRTQGKRKRPKGSIITINLKMTQDEARECFDYAKEILFPKHIDYTVNYSVNGDMESVSPKYNPPFKTFEAMLRTEINNGDAFRSTIRKTVVEVRRHGGTKYLYEMGIPVCEIDCDYSIDVMQKVPLSADRDSVSPAFVRDLYAEVLNNVHTDVTEDIVSNPWVHEASSSNRITKDALKTVVEERFGDKVVSFNPNDPNANDEALSRGFKVIHGAELSGDMWSKVKQFGLIQSSTAMFGKSLVGFDVVKPTSEQERVGNWCKKFFKDFFGQSLIVEFISSPRASTVADFSTNHLRFNVVKVNMEWVDGNRVGERMLNLIIHEFGHQKGNHTEHAYHEALTKMGAWLTIKALKEPSYFKL
jgi:hypothetical protein